MERDEERNAKRRTVVLKAAITGVAAGVARAVVDWLIRCLTQA